MIQKKVCMLGAHGVGKTSLVRRYVHSIFSEKYHSTIGVKIDKREVQVDDRLVKLLLWDVAGEESNFSIPPSYMVGAAGGLLVIDGTRRETVETACDIFERLRSTAGDIPVVIVLNKADLADEWEIEDVSLKCFEGRPVLKSSAKTGEGVEEAFLLLTRTILGL
jgi:small GTP-binding protein